MANRSHLYTCDEVPGGKGFYARGLSEYNWDIPLVHKLMVAGNPQIVRSAIWEHDIGILADREGAFERTLAFFEKVGEGDLGDRKEYDEELAQMKEFLASTPPSKYILLEAGEILDLQGEDLNKLVADLHAEISELAARAAAAVAGQDDTWLGELRAEWQEKARPGYWSDILYYSFEPSDGDEAGAGDGNDGSEAAPSEIAAATKPAAKQPAAKPAAKKAASKKPAAKKAAAKKPAAKQAAAKKKAGKKPAAKKKAGKKPAAKKSAVTKKPAKSAAKRPVRKPGKKKR